MWRKQHLISSRLAIIQLHSSKTESGFRVNEWITEQELSYGQRYNTKLKVVFSR